MDLSNVVPLFKKDRKLQELNYHPVTVGQSITGICDFYIVLDYSFEMSRSVIISGLLHMYSNSNKSAWFMGTIPPLDCGIFSSLSSLCVPFHN